MGISEEVKEVGHGGKRAGSGRRVSSQPMLKKTVSLTERDFSYLVATGDGKLSVGVRLLVEQSRSVKP